MQGFTFSKNCSSLDRLVGLMPPAAAPLVYSRSSAVSRDTSGCTGHVHQAAARSTRATELAQNTSFNPICCESTAAVELMFGKCPFMVEQAHTIATCKTKQMHVL